MQTNWKQQGFVNNRNTAFCQFDSIHHYFLCHDTWEIYFLWKYFGTPIHSLRETKFKLNCKKCFTKDITILIYVHIERHNTLIKAIPERKVEDRIAKGK